MRITTISILTPYKENYHGTSALPYHLMVYRPKDVDIEIYSFNNNNLPAAKIKEVEEELRVKIHLVPLPRWYKLVFALHLLFIRLFLRYPIHHYITMPKKYVESIKSRKPDGIWIYGEEMSKVADQFKGYKRLHTLPDSEALYYYRILGTRFVMNDWRKYWRCAFMYPKFRHMERDFDRNKTIHYHLVGEADAQFLREMAPGIQAHFIRHPHYEVCQHNDERHFHTPIRLLIAGQYNYYMKQDADEIFKALCNVNQKDKDVLINNYEITFLGHGWEQIVTNMKDAGWEAKQISFAPDYIEEVVKHDVQLVPISIGTGTKGKVLDALANGLLAIGSKFAMENIAVENDKSCIIYNNSEDVIRVLLSIINDRQKFEHIASAGRKSVLYEHDRERVSALLFRLLH